MQARHNDKKADEKMFVTLCGRTFQDTDAAWFPQVSYKRGTLRFCTDACLHAFEADSKAFVQAHRKRGHGIDVTNESTVEVGRR